MRLQLASGALGAWLGFATLAPRAAARQPPERASAEPRTPAADVEGAPEPVDEVVVTVERRRPLTASTVRLGARDLSSVPRRTAEDALRLVPGVTVVQHGSEGKGHQFFVRGFDAMHGADLELSVAGIPINEWSNVHGQGYIDLGFLVPEVIRSVEVIKGPFALGQGAFAMAGSARYELGVPLGDLGWRATYTLGSTGRQRLVATHSPVGGDGRDFVALEALHDAGFGENRRVRRGSALGSVRLVDTAAFGTLAVLGSVYRADFELPGALRNRDVQLGRVGFFDTYDPAGNGRSERAWGALSYAGGSAPFELEARVFGGFRRLSLLENFTGFLLDPIAGDRRAQAQRTWSVGSEASWRMPVSSGWAVVAGLGVRRDSFEQAQDHVDQQRARLARERDLSGSQSALHARSGVEWQGLGGVRARAGIRFDLAHVAVRDGLAEPSHAAGTVAAVSPRLSLDVRFDERWSWFAAYGRGFRPPEARAFSSYEPEQTGIGDEPYRGGEPAMVLSDAVELGARFRPSASTELRSSAFATFIAREAVFDHVSGLNLELEGTRRLGAELGMTWQPSSLFQLHADVTWVHARFVRSGGTVPFAPEAFGTLRSSFGESTGLRGGLGVFAVAPRALPHGARGSTLLSVDATLGYWWSWLRLDLELENLLDRRLREGEYHYASHFWPGDPASALPELHFVAGPPFNARLGVTLLL